MGLNGACRIGRGRGPSLSLLRTSCPCGTSNSVSPNFYVSDRCCKSRKFQGEPFQNWGLSDRGLVKPCCAASFGLVRTIDVGFASLFSWPIPCQQLDPPFGASTILPPSLPLRVFVFALGTCFADHRHRQNCTAVKTTARRSGRTTTATACPTSSSAPPRRKRYRTSRMAPHKNAMTLAADCRSNCGIRQPAHEPHLPCPFLLPPPFFVGEGATYRNFTQPTHQNNRLTG